MTPDELSSRIGVPAKRIRGFLRDRYPRSAAEKHSPWYLNSEQIAEVCQHFKKPVPTRA